ncbi:MAG: hypothetical protein EXX96DRAFT_496206 [Benjaminiella poitrasii]|nr:MAG: hypothetical protein EXX96DRAFT_496206 [Benjaminiella poitrasii]
MFVGGRGLDVDSRIQGHLRYGGNWKAQKHSLYTSVCVTNEHNSSKTCPFCFHKISHPIKILNKDGRKIIKTVNDTSVCSNPNCISVKAKSSHRGRDSLSALIIGLSGLASLPFGYTFTIFSPYNASHSNTRFRTIATSFLNRNKDRPTIDDGNTLL